ncbi:MAG TPA: PEP-CTERM sorting domain-containing protein [Verrucomicrobiota bacterium]|nr:PEP-CTERM sorting domain-containing protein [Verrucomicrobiota bacterium]
MTSLALSAQASDYLGNGNSSWGGAVGLGTLSLTHTSTDLNITLTKGPGNLDNALVLYIDSVAGGFMDTSTLSDDGDGARSAISGYTSTGNGGGPGRSTMTFLSGFEPDYAVAIEGGYASLFGLASGGQWSLSWITGANQSGSGSPTFSLSFPLANIGVADGGSFDLFGTYVSGTGYRSQEAIAGNDSGSDGWNPFTQTSFVTYMVPEPSTLTLLCLPGLAVLYRIRRRK